MADDDARFAQLTTVLRDAWNRLDQTERRDQEARAVFDQLVDVLVGRGLLNDGHRRNFERLRRSPPTSQRRVHLSLVEDKYTVPSADIDCAARMHLCRARCCTFTVALSKQDIEQRLLQFELEEPYLLRHDHRDGRCVHQDKSTGGCLVHHHRPATCRSYDCRNDRRIWEDFEKMIPAAEVATLIPPLEK